MGYRLLPEESDMGPSWKILSNLDNKIIMDQKVSMIANTLAYFVTDKGLFVTNFVTNTGFIGFRPFLVGKP
jgi:hypothetical protein